MIKIGTPAPGKRWPDGKDWDDKGKSKLFGFCVFYTDQGIRAVQFFYDVNSNVVVSDSTSGFISCCKFKRVQLNYPSEYLTSVSGLYRLSSSDSIIKCITFGTNKGKYGPYGPTNLQGIGAPDITTDCFDWDWGPDNVFDGFYGTHGTHYLHAIGVYIKPPSIPLQNRPLKPDLTNSSNDDHEYKDCCTCSS